MSSYSRLHQELSRFDFSDQLVIVLVNKTMTLGRALYRSYGTALSFWVFFLGFATSSSGLEYRHGYHWEILTLDQAFNCGSL